MALVFDIETNGFLHQTTTCHVLVIKDTETKEMFVYNSQGSKPEIKEGVKKLQKATNSGIDIVAHNGIKFDIPALKKLYPCFNPDEKHVKDTLVCTRVIWPDLYEADSKLIKAGKLLPNLINKHSLEAWGWRLGEHKASYTGGFQLWNEDMEAYCIQDVITLEALWNTIQNKDYSSQSLQLEHDVARIVSRQERYGFMFDKEKAASLYAKLVTHKLQLDATLQEVFKPRLLKDGKVKTPKIDNKRYNYAAGAMFTPIAMTTFNPGSRDHIAKWFHLLFGWKPQQFTDDGKPKVDEAVLNELKYPEAKLLAEYMMVVKRIAQLAEGDQAWLRHVKDDNRIHGGVNTNGAVTGRMTHSTPNLAQVPAVYSPYGKDCRGLFTVPEGNLLVGIDAAALELRCLAGYMAKYDEGNYINVVVNGKKEDGTEIHTVNRKALNIDSRDDAKTWFYAFIYGAGDEKLGSILTKKSGATSAGKQSRARFFKNLPALGHLVSAVQAKVGAVGHLKGLDGRVLKVRAKHSALNTLLQSAGAVMMKVALVHLDNQLMEKGYVPGINYEFVANVHDEWQIECDSEIAEVIGMCAVEAIRESGRILKFKCPLDGEYRVGRNWQETH